MSEQADIHARLMSVYPQVPDWWYGIIFCEFILILITRLRLTARHQWQCSRLELYLLKFGLLNSQYGHLY